MKSIREAEFRSCVVVAASLMLFIDGFHFGGPSWTRAQTWRDRSKLDASGQVSFPHLELDTATYSPPKYLTSVTVHGSLWHLRYKMNSCLSQTNKLALISDIRILFVLTTWLVRLELDENYRFLTLLFALLTLTFTVEFTATNRNRRWIQIDSFLGAFLTLNLFPLVSPTFLVGQDREENIYIYMYKYRVS